MEPTIYKTSTKQHKTHHNAQTKKQLKQKTVKTQTARTKTAKTKTARTKNTANAGSYRRYHIMIPTIKKIQCQRH